MIPADQEITVPARLLLLLSRDALTAEEQLQAERICSSVTDWRPFTDLAIRNGVAALVWQNLTDLNLASAVSEAERKILEGIRLRAIARVSYIISQATVAVKALENAGIRVLLLKGLALEHTVYGSRGLRQMSDADLLVSPDDILKARDVLTSVGFVSQPLKSSLYRHIILDLGNHLPEMHRGGMSIDLHHRLFGRKGIEMVRDAIRAPAVVTSGGDTFYVLPPATAFLGLVSHIFKHRIKGEFQLRLYTDVYLLLKKHFDEIINENLKDYAQQAGIESEMRIVLTIIKQSYGLEFPAIFNAANEHEKAMADCFTDNISHPQSLELQSPRIIYQENLRSLPGLKKKLIFITGDLFPSVGFMKKRYGSRTVAGLLLHYPHRLGKLIWIFDLITAELRGK